MSEYKSHYSVMNKDFSNHLDHLDKNESWNFADLTFGAGGHTKAMREKFPNSKILCIDQDLDALNNGKELFKTDENIFFFHGNFSRWDEAVKDFSDHFRLDEVRFNSVIADLGVSSHHFDEGERGFSFRYEAPLDMRMNQSGPELTAAQIVNEWSESELREVLTDFGEERFAHVIAKNICEKRQESKITTTKELEDIVFHSYPKKMRFGKSNPSTKTFQALRIVVNKELEVLEGIIPKVFKTLNEDGRFMIISFHSLEDRIVKRSFKEIYKSHRDIVGYFTKKPLIPSEGEISENSRSRSAKMRVVEKIKEVENGKKKWKSKKPD